jgi:uncharacterized protein (DUF433 family)
MATIEEVAGLLEVDPHYMGGWVVIKGTGVPVVAVAYSHLNEDWDPDELARQWTLSLEQVHIALAFYFANREAIDREVEEAGIEGEQLAAESPSKLLVAI